MRALLSRYPYTSLLILAIVAVPLIWAIDILSGFHPSDLTDAVDVSLGILFGAGWIAKWERR